MSFSLKQGGPDGLNLCSYVVPFIRCVGVCVQQFLQETWWGELGVEHCSDVMSVFR